MGTAHAQLVTMATYAIGCVQVELAAMRDVRLVNGFVVSAEFFEKCTLQHDKTTKSRHLMSVRVKKSAKSDFKVF